MENINLNFILLSNYIGDAVPFYATEGSAGMDLVAAISDSITLKPLQRYLVPNGLKLILPLGYEAQIRPRSGLALQYGVTVLNSPGTVDSDYRGEIKTLLINLGQDDFLVIPGMRISQMVVARVNQVKLVPTTQVVDSSRGEGGFGSTGI